MKEHLISNVYIQKLFQMNFTNWSIKASSRQALLDMLKTFFLRKLQRHKHIQKHLNSQRSAKHVYLILTDLLSLTILQITTQWHHVMSL